jgi:SPP1 family predicted phage head-tail adaptor
MTLEAGTLNRRVSLQRKVIAQDQTTEAQVETWVEVAKVWANIRYLNGTETIKAATPTSIAKASIRIRARDDVADSWRVVRTKNGKDTFFNITTVLRDEQGGEFIDLAVETGGRNG